VETSSTWRIISIVVLCLGNGALSYFCFIREEVEIATVFLFLFISAVVFAYSLYEFHQKKILWTSVGYWIIWIVLALMLLLTGFFSGNIIHMTFGAFLVLIVTSSFLTFYVRSEHVVKRILEVVLLFSALGTIAYGYFVTKSMIFGIGLLFVAALFLIAFLLSYLRT